MVKVGCASVEQMKGTSPRCSSGYFELIWQALRQYNVTLVVNFYKDPKRLYSDLFRGHVDVSGDLTAATESISRDFSIPFVLDYLYETFYVKDTDPHPVSFIEILTESKNVGEEACACLQKTLNYATLFYSFDWFPLEDKAVYMFNRLLCNSHSNISYDFENVNRTREIGLVWLQPNQCSNRRQTADSKRQKPSKLRNRMVKVGCTSVEQMKGTSPRCSSGYFELIWQALRQYNVTLVVNFYKDPKRLYTDLFRGHVDVSGDLTAATESISRDFSIPFVLDYLYETFYVKDTDPHPVSFIEILTESK
ncbi:hypothetical protein V5799_008363, partial [Amblyomma americanum]